MGSSYNIHLKYIRENLGFQRVKLCVEGQDEIHVLGGSVL